MIDKSDRRLVVASVGCVVLLACACVLALPAPAYINQQLAVANGPVVVTYQMRWTNEPYGRCDTYVVLEFETSPGYVISACSRELLATLQASGTNPVAVRFTRTAEPHLLETLWHYKLEQVGGWTGSASFEGLSQRCFFNAGDNPAASTCDKGRLPILEPYTLK